jgi:hypothetical protein
MSVREIVCRCTECTLLGLQFGQSKDDDITVGSKLYLVYATTASGRVAYIWVLVQNVLPRNVLPRNVLPRNVLPHNVLLDKTSFLQNVLLYKTSSYT